MTMNIAKNPSSNNDETLKPERKKLKSCEPDLKITVGGRNGDDNDATEYWYHASTMASHSNYIDTMLASPMQESNTYEIRFPDVARVTWDSMMKFLEAPAEARLMTAEDVMEVAPLYDQYDFPQGRKLCGQVLKEHFQDKKKILSNVGLFVDAVLLTDTAHINEAKEMGSKSLIQTIESRDLHSGPIIFTEDHMKKLAPLIAKEDSLFQCLTSSYIVPSVKTKEDILSPLFPFTFVLACKHSETYNVLQREVDGVKLTGTKSKADGMFAKEFTNDFEYKTKRTGRWGGVEVTFRITQERDGWDWAITSQTLPVVDEDSDGDGEEAWLNVVENILWKCPNSHNMPMPPRTGWISVDKMAHGKPELSYQLQDSDYDNP
jgi:hypothetical protein